MKITIFGATGRTGRHLTRMALAQGHEVTALVRYENKLEPDNDKLSAVVGNVFVPGDVEKAIEGSDAVLYAIGCTTIREKDTVARGTELVVKAMQQRDIPVTYVLYSDEGHGFARPENSMSFWAVTEAFLAEHLGGRFEPVGSSFQGSTVAVPAGAEHVPGLTEALEESTS